MSIGRRARNSENATSPRAQSSSACFISTRALLLRVLTLAAISPFAIGCIAGSIVGMRELDGLKFEGNKLLSDKEIQKGLTLEPSSWIPLVGAKRYFNDDIVREDLRRVPRIYEAEGVYGTTVVGWRLEDANKDSADLVVTVKEGVPVNLVDVSYEGLPTDLAGKEPEPALRIGERFREDSYDRTKKALLDFLQSQGHQYAKVEGRAIIDEPKKEARVIFAMQPGTRYLVGPLHFPELENVETEQLREHVSLVPGTQYDDGVRKETEERLGALNVFRTVSVNIPDKAPPGNEIPVNVRVAEGPAQAVKLGGGLGVATSRQEVRGRAQYTHNNFLGGLRRFDVELRPAYVFVPSFSKPDKSGIAGSGSVRLYQPDFLLERGVHRTGGTLSVGGSRDIQDAYTSDSAAARAGLIWPTDSSSHVEGGYDFEVFSLGSLPPSVKQCEGFCFISYLDQKFVWDKRNSLTFPKKGYWLSLALAEAGLGGDFRYIRAVPEGRAYLNPLDWLTFASRVQLGFMFHKKGADTPIPKRFTLGGPTSHRGFGPRRLAPSVVNRKGRRVPIGGESSILFNQEIRIETIDKLYFITFFDTGAVKDQQNNVPADILNHAVGAGIEYDTGVIPVRFDVGYRTNRRPEYQREPAIAFHLNLGEAF